MHRHSFHLVQVGTFLCFVPFSCKLRFATTISSSPGLSLFSLPAMSLLDTDFGFWLIHQAIQKHSTFSKKEIFGGIPTMIKGRARLLI